MNFTPFSVGVPLSAALPVATQFAAAGKITQAASAAGGQVVGVLQGCENGVHYIRPLDANAFAAAGAAQAAAAAATSSAAQGQQTLITLPITMPGAKPGDPQQTVQIQVVNTAAQQQQPPPGSQAQQQQQQQQQSPKYQISQIPIQTFGQGATVLTVAYNSNQEGIQIIPIQTFGQGATVLTVAYNSNQEGIQIIPIQTFGQGATVLTVAYNSNQEGIQILDGQNGIPEGMTVVAAIQPQDIQIIPAQQAASACGDEKNGSKDVSITPVALIKSEVNSKDDMEGATTATITMPATASAAYIQTNTVQEYLKMHNSSLPLSLQQFLKFNNTEVKREQITEDGVIETVVEGEGGGGSEQHLIMNDIVDEMEPEEITPTPEESGVEKGKKKKKYKKKPPKPKKPKPGQVHIATALDGTTLFCCPECHMAYPEKELLEQHLIGHKIERRFICDICGAGLKRKEHLERHKLGHNPERPYVCSVCMKGFKRKEHLNLHYVIHSGEKTEICNECGKGFYRKDHLRKHARSHIARRAKEALQQQQQQQQQSQPSQQAGQGQGGGSIKEATVTIQVPNSQLQIPLQIQVPQHHLVPGPNSEEESSQQQVSTVVLPSEPISIIPH